jgi:hypothetical protein
MQEHCFYDHAIRMVMGLLDQADAIVVKAVHYSFNASGKVSVLGAEVWVDRAFEGRAKCFLSFDQRCCYVFHF